jgi:hypothetical protein
MGAGTSRNSGEPCAALHVSRLQWAAACSYPTQGILQSDSLPEHPESKGESPISISPGCLLCASDGGLHRSSRACRSDRGRR